MLDRNLRISIFGSVLLHVAALTAILLLSAPMVNPIMVDLRLILPAHISEYSGIRVKENFVTEKSIVNFPKEVSRTATGENSHLDSYVNIKHSDPFETGQESKLPNELSEIENQYALRLRAILEEKMVFPEAAKKLRLKGRVTLRLHLDSSGTILSFGIAEGSGDEILDQAALRLFDQVQNFPAFPSEVLRRDWLFFIPIEYRN